MYACIHTYIYHIIYHIISQHIISYIISYHFVGPQILLYKQSDMKLVRKKQHKQRNKNTIQNRTDIQMPILQSPNTNTVHNMIIE
jgi:hypothetical protein